ncbi:hypothetical protein GWI33_017768 [Rhynchophorus ferrugineus]|uniref:Uncharacterized protein n=1 Tax=Rhynchophorus ferrugineus TaxID=354439 RepID=A0A834HVE3_RHYFE|nr:hypothetical protein GWI33_017768 [Rhynchophorus ferrugineus]
MVEISINCLSNHSIKNDRFGHVTRCCRWKIKAPADYAPVPRIPSRHSSPPSPPLPSRDIERNCRGNREFSLAVPFSHLAHFVVIVSRRRARKRGQNRIVDFDMHRVRR